MLAPRFLLSNRGLTLQFDRPKHHYQPETGAFQESVGGCLLNGLHPFDFAQDRFESGVHLLGYSDGRHLEGGAHLTFMEI
jgi:hypothetical protein